MTILTIAAAGLILTLVVAGLAGQVLSSRDPKARPDGEPVFVDLDVLRQIESGGRCAAVSGKGARGPYQLGRAAWMDAIRSVAARDPQAAARITDYDPWSCDEPVSRCIAWEYMTHCIPGYLRAKSLYRDDSTGPVPDSIDARLAAYNAGALAVRRAYARNPPNWLAEMPHETREYISRYHRELARQRMVQKAAAKS